MQSIDAELVEATLKGDRDAFSQLVKKHQSFLLGYALKRLKNLADAEEIVQEAFLKAYQNLSVLQDYSKFAGWLYQITNNLCVSWLRRQKCKLKSLEALANTNSRYNPLTPEQILEQKESSECIVRAVEALPEKESRVFTLYLEGFSYRDIATSLDIPTSTVLGRLQTAKRRLRDNISEYMPFAAAPGPLRIAMEQLRKDGFTMEEILKHPLRRRIYGISNKYEVRWENDNGKLLPPQEVVGYLFREMISGRVYPDLFMENGARIHSDDNHGFVQYATPECDDILQLIAHEKAGERILERLSLSAAANANRRGFKGRMSVYKTAACTENYLLSKDVKPEQLRNQLVPFLLTRQIFAGAGKAIVLESDNRYHIFRRANQIKVDISTSAKDGIVRIPDNPHADEERCQRLQVLIGDANMSEWASYLKIGSTALVIQMLEDDFIPNDFALQNPVIASKQMAVDPKCTEKIELSSGKWLTAIEIQREYLHLAKSHFDSLEVAPHPRPLSTSLTPKERGVKDVLAKWEYALDCLESDPMRLDSEVDWVIKKRLLEKYRDERNLEWRSAEILKMDFGYHNIRRAEGLYYHLEQEGKVKRLLTDEQIEESIHEPPQTTRAKFRGKYVKLANEKRILCGVNWSYIQIYEPEQKLFLSTDPLEPEYMEASKIIY